ncbi:LPXTG cell wall anchor domain-containing protein [Ruminococcaceae bacterium OttesenSCG-928-I18]|nr:LPXTG cell wall anchor domain-containing protein [Ruminococcaceae bacterium OttesenSCG-928-I18]
MQKTMQKQIAALLLCFAILAALVLTLPLPVHAAESLSLISEVGTDDQHVHVGEAITSIEYNSSGGTLIQQSVSGLPDGVRWIISNGSVRIFGAAASNVTAGAYSYTVTGKVLSETVTASGTITVYTPTLNLTNVPAEMIQGGGPICYAQLTGGIPNHPYGTVTLSFAGASDNLNFDTNASGSSITHTHAFLPKTVGPNQTISASNPYFTVIQDAPSTTVYTTSPQTPGSPTATDHRDGTVTFNWTPVSDVKGYNIRTTVQPPTAQIVAGATSNSVTLSKADVGSGPYEIQSYVADSDGGGISSAAAMPTFTATPITANASNNTFVAPTSVDAGDAFTLNATGDWQTAPDGSVIQGDERYIPKSWSVNSSGTFTENAGVYTANVTLDTPGTHTLTVTYLLQRFDGTAWQDTGDIDTKTQIITVNAAPSSSQPSSSSPAPSSSKPGSSSAVSSSSSSAVPAAPSGAAPTNTSGSPQTGDTALPFAYGGLALLSALGVVLARRKR